MAPTTASLSTSSYSNMSSEVETEETSTTHHEPILLAECELEHQNEQQQQQQQQQLHTSNHAVQAEVIIDTTESLKDRRLAAKMANRAYRRASVKSNVLSHTKTNDIALVTMDELSIGKWLGKGSFSNVHEINKITLHDDNTADIDANVRQNDDINYGIATTNNSNNKEARNILSTNYLRHDQESDTITCRYAIKFLKKELRDNPKRYAVGTTDLVLEGLFLASLTHPNIIKVRGLPLGGVECIQHNGEGMGYFLVLDRLFDTLSDRIYKHWVHSHNDIPLIKKKKGFQRLLFKNYPNGVRNNNQMNMNRNADLAVRVKVAFDISAALKYLHEKNIIYRDLKPENLGFDVRGDIKLFDLGLVKELHPEAQDHRGNWKLSMAGTPRYMSPECGTYQRYNLSADVYSFSMLLWEMISLKQPFKGFTYSQLKTEIFIDGDRPPLEMIWHKELRSLIKVGWHQNPAKRPSMDAVYDKLRDVYTAIKPGVVNEEEISHNRRRSTYVNFRQLVWKESGEKEGASIHQ